MPDFDVVTLSPTAHPEVGETAPDFTRPLVTDEYWEEVSLSELTDGGPVVLVFHPMDGAFPATYFWNEIRSRNWGNGDAQSDSADTSGQPENGASGSLTVVGVSISSPYEHKSFIEEREMDYRLFSDPDAGVAAEYGIEHDLDGMAGVTEHRPAMFLLDGDRTVEYAWVASEWPEFPDYDEIEQHIERS